MNETAAIIRRHSRSFSLAARLIPREYRFDIYRLYAWCRAVDDLVDEPAISSTARQDLVRLKRDLRLVAAGHCYSHPTTQWIAPLIRAGKVQARHAEELIEGMELDLLGFQVYTEDDLRRYCYHAAGTVGLMMTEIMGVRQQVAKSHAVALGVAMQMTNIARDVREDALRGRSYLPGITAPLVAPREQVIKAVRSLIKRAECEYAFALEGIGYLPVRCRTAIRVAATVYRQIGRQILQEGCPVLDRRTIVPRWKMLVVAANAVLFPSRQPPRRSTIPSQIPPFRPV